ncbi:quinoprotein glucose dehydrogenase [Alteribacter lacisalsi]|uniref:Quinoprotein glucose dehydrogenase n=1 Tax=Alteribacter lacisalsi TaxID=2045244 RepID=A0A2W0HTY3_9BACI|nr:sorbosone dehydrogenase family protein [Alteribacter lacisalsi]PYZ97088.1 quinoprotein glucose dehydrogenase [Alteribacter lacisalsi]
MMKKCSFFIDWRVFNNDKSSNGRQINRVKVTMILAAGLFLSGCESEETGEQGDGGDSREEITGETIAENLDVPWNIAQTNGTFYITERDGMIAEIDSAGDIQREPVKTEEAILSRGEGGLLGMVMKEDFADNGEAIVYHTYEAEDGSIMNRIVTVQKEEGEWSETGVLLDEIPGAAIHNGGRLEIGPDGYLYAATGDADEPDWSQNRDNHAGAILRMTLDGEIPGDNPFPDSYIYSYGHRNPQGMTWLDDVMYSTEHGPVAQDEINVIEPGRNYGWPVISGDETEEGMETPLVHSGQDTWAPSGMTIFEGRILFAGLRGEALYELDPEEEGISLVYDGAGRIRDVWSDGEYLYAITSNTDGRGDPVEGDDRLIRLTVNQ